MTDQAAQPGIAPLPMPREEHRLTMRSFIAGTVLAIVLCAVNSYLTLSFGIMEEGPAIAALFFFACFFMSKTKITTAEMVIVATMGSAGGSLGFISNFFAAKAMTGTPYTIWEMALFAIVSSIVGLAAVFVLRQILIIKNAELPEAERLPWVGSKAVKGVIDTLVTHGDPMQARYLAFCTLAAIIYVVFNTEGIGWFPEVGMITIGGLVAYSAGLAFSPFLVGGAYLMGFRTSVGFLVGGITLLIMAPHLPTPAAPHKFVWPGIAFLITSGLTALLIKWRVIYDALKSLSDMRGGVDDTPIMSKRGMMMFTVIGLGVASFCLYFFFHLTVIVIIGMLAIGGLVLNLIATRAAAQTAFNPARVMGIILQGVCALLGGQSVATNLTGAGMVAGSGAQAGNLTGDMAYGFWFRVRSSWQFWTQASTVIACSFVAAWVFYLIRTNFHVSLDGGDLAAPVAKIWATMGLLFDPASQQELPSGAITALWIAGLLGIVWAVAESFPKVRRWIPCSIGLGLGLILPVAYDFGFFFGGVLMWYILGRFLKFQEMTLNTIAVALIVGEGAGGILTGILKTTGVISH